MSHIIRVLFALQICMLFVVGCAVDGDDADAVDTSTDVAEPSADEAAAAPDYLEAAEDGAATAQSVTEKAICTRIRLDNRATLNTCRNTCRSRGQNALGFDNVSKICRCCSAGPI